jgi:hypothetical protein
MSYRLCFLANSVRPAGRRGLVNVREEDVDDGSEQLTEEELREVNLFRHSWFSFFPRFLCD